MGIKVPTVAVIGGTGDLGNGLARRWAAAGYPVVIGSRAAARGASAAAEICRDLDVTSVSGADNSAAAAAGDIVVLAVPKETHGVILEAIKDTVAGKIVVDTTVPLNPPKVARVQLPESGTMANATQAVLGDGTRVVAAFHNVAAGHLADLSHAIDCDILVFGDDSEARQAIVELAEAASMTGWHAGSLDNAVVGEALTSVLIFINRRYKIDGAGLRITGQPKPETADAES